MCKCVCLREAAMQCFVSNSFINMIIIFPWLFSALSLKKSHKLKKIIVCFCCVRVYVWEIFFFLIIVFFSLFVCMKKKHRERWKKSVQTMDTKRQAKFVWCDATGFLFFFFFWILMPAGVSSPRVTWPACFPPSSPGAAARDRPPISPVSSNMGSSLGMKPANISSVNKHHTSVRADARFAQQSASNQNKVKWKP